MGVEPEAVYRRLADPTDERYRAWWPGTHTAFHVVRRAGSSPVGDVTVMDERVGRRRLRFRAVVQVADPGRRLVWQLGKGIPGPAWLDITVTAIPGGTRVEHVLRIGYDGIAGRLTDPLIRLYFTDAFADALTVHAMTEFPLLAPGASPPDRVRPLPRRRSWRKAFASIHGRTASRGLLTDLELHYAQVVADRPDFISSYRGRFELSLAPLLAAHRVFAAREDPDPVRRVAELNEVRLAPFARTLAVLARLPVPWPLLRRSIDAAVRTISPEPGWSYEWREASDRRLAFDVRSCLYLRTFTYYGVPELTTVGCAGDDQLFARLPGARFVRMGTLGRGADRCDFCFERH